MLVRNCKLTPADVEVSSSPPPSRRPGPQHPPRRSRRCRAVPAGTSSSSSDSPSHSAVHPAPWKSPLRGVASGSALLLPTLASCPGLVPAAKPAYFPALSQVHRQQWPEPLPGEVSSTSFHTHTRSVPAPQHTHTLTVCFIQIPYVYLCPWACVYPSPHMHLYYLPVSSCAPHSSPDTHHSLTAFVHLPHLSSRWLFSPQHPLPPPGSLPDLDIYLYNKPGGQGTGGKGTVWALAGVGKPSPVPWLRGLSQPCL